MFIAGLRRIDRLRGSGWLDCPHCHEHAAQDVIDEMTFVALWFYRFGAVHRRRDLLCRCCNVRRPAAAELAGLNTAGRPVRRGPMIPVGLIGLVLVSAASFAAFTPTDALSRHRLDFVTLNVGRIGPFRFDVPSSWNHSVAADADPPYAEADDRGTAGELGIKLRRVGAVTSPPDLVLQHFRDEAGLGAEGFPVVAPPGTCTRVADQRAIRLVMNYRLSEQPSRVTMYAFFHDGVGYTLNFTANGAESVTLMEAIERRVVGSAGFDGAEPAAAATTAAGAAGGIHRAAC